MTRSILVPLDGSAFSAQVIPYAVNVARALKANVEFVQVHIPAYPKPWLDGLTEEDLRWEQETRQQERDDLERVAARVSEEWGIVAHFDVLEGDVVGAILRHAREKNVAMIVIATHGRGGVSRVWLGSMADRVIRRSPVPILLFHPRQDSAWTPSVEPFDHILIPLDGSPRAETVLPFALGLGGKSAKYTLTRVLPSADVLAVSPPILSALRSPHDSRQDQQAMDYLLNIAQALAARGYDAEVFLKAHPQPAVAILEHAYECGADAIAISTHGRQGLSRAALGSVADKLLRGFHKPVLIYRPPATGVPKRSRLTAAETTV